MVTIMAIQNELHDLQSGDFSHIIQLMRRSKIFNDKFSMKRMLKYIVTVSLSRPILTPIYAKIVVQLFMETTFLSNFFDFKAYTLKHLVKAIGKETSMSLLASQIQLLFYIKSFGGFTGYHTVSRINYFYKRQRLSFVSQIWLFCLFAPDFQRYFPQVFAELKQSFDNAVDRKALPLVFEDFHQLFEELQQDDWALFHEYTNPSPQRMYTLVNALLSDDDTFVRDMSVYPTFNTRSSAPLTLLFAPPYPGSSATLLDCAAFLGAVRCFRYLYLCTRPFDVDLRRLAQHAVAGGNHEIIRLCTQASADCQSCVETAVRFHRGDILRWMVEGNAGTAEAAKAAETAARANNLEAVSILAAYDSVPPTALHAAARGAALECVKLLGLLGADVNGLDGLGMTPLHHAVLSESVACVKLVLSLGGDTEATDFTGDTPRDVAVANGLDRIAAALEARAARRPPAERERRRITPEVLDALEAAIRAESAALKADTTEVREYADKAFYNVFVRPVGDSRFFGAPYAPTNNNNGNNNNN